MSRPAMKPAQGFSDDLTRCDVISFGTGLNRLPQLRIDSHRDDVGRS